MTAPRQQCPMCGTRTTPVRGHAALCFTCTLEDLGQTWEQIRARVDVTMRKAAKRMAGGRTDSAVLR